MSGPYVSLDAPRHQDDAPRSFRCNGKAFALVSSLVACGYCCQLWFKVVRQLPATSGSAIDMAALQPMKPMTAQSTQPSSRLRSGLVQVKSTAKASQAKGAAVEAPPIDDLHPLQKYGPSKPAHEWPKPWTNIVTQEKVQGIKAVSQALKEPLKTDMADDEIFVSDESIHILKHHGSYMQQNRMLKGQAKKDSYQFMLRLKVPCGEMPASVYRELDDLSNLYGQGDLRATTRQAFQLHGVLKGNLKKVVATITNIGSGTAGGCGDISRNVMTPPVHFPNNPAYTYTQQYARALADLFKPSAEVFRELWLDGEKAMETEYWQRDIGEFNLDEVRVEDRGNGIITGHPQEPLYGRTYLPKKFKIAITVPEDNGVDLYINDVGCVVIMKPDGKTLDGFNIVVGGGMGRTHGVASTVAYAAKHLGYIPQEDFFEAMKAILATQRDHGNREVRAQARLKYLVNTLGIDDFRILVEKYLGRAFEPWRPLPEWKYIDWMGWTDQGDGNWMLGINIEQGRVRDTPELKLKTALRKMVDTYPHTDLLLTPSQSVIFRNIKPEDKDDVQALLVAHGVKMIDEIDPITRNSIACPAFPLCGLAMTEAERVQPEINARIWALLQKMGLSDTHLVTRTTGCPNGCARPYMAELAFVGNGPLQYQIWLGGHHAQGERTAFESHLKKLKLVNMEKEFEPIFAMYKEQRLEQLGGTAGGHESFGDFCYRVGRDAIKDYSEQYLAARAPAGEADAKKPKAAPKAAAKPPAATAAKQTEVIEVKPDAVAAVAAATPKKDAVAAVAAATSKQPEAIEVRPGAVAAVAAATPKQPEKPVVAAAPQYIYQG